MKNLKFLVFISSLASAQSYIPREVIWDYKGVEVTTSLLSAQDHRDFLEENSILIVGHVLIEDQKVVKSVRSLDVHLNDFLHYQHRLNQLDIKLESISTLPLNKIIMFSKLIDLDIAEGRILVDNVIRVDSQRLSKTYELFNLIGTDEGRSKLNLLEKDLRIILELGLNQSKYMRFLHDHQKIVEGMLDFELEQGTPFQVFQSAVFTNLYAIYAIGDIFPGALKSIGWDEAMVLRDTRSEVNSIITK